MISPIWQGIRLEKYQRGLIHSDKFSQKVWYKVGSGASEGWIADDDGKLKKLSAFDWAKFKIAKERGSAADDTKIDFKNLSPFFKTIIDEINTDKDDKISAKELKAAMKNPDLTEKLSHLICFHQSEWYLDDGLTSWQKVLKKVGLYKAEKMELQLKELCWWREVADNSKLFLKSPDVYHWHPIAFVEQMQELDDELETLMKKERLTAKEIARARMLISELNNVEQADYFTRLQEKVNYRNQRNNDQTKYISDRMCNLTSLAMALEYLGVENPEPSMQFEDYLEKQRVEKGYEHRTDDDSWEKLAANFDVGMKNIPLSTSDKNKLVSKLKTEIESGKGVVISAFSYASGKGHIVRLQGIGDEGLIVDDPFGRINDFKQREDGGSGYTGTSNTRASEAGKGEDNLWKWEDIKKTTIKYADAFYPKE